MHQSNLFQLILNRESHSNRIVEILLGSVHLLRIDNSNLTSRIKVTNPKKILTSKLNNLTRWSQREMMRKLPTLRRPQRIASEIINPSIRTKPTTQLNEKWLLNYESS